MIEPARRIRSGRARVAGICFGTVLLVICADALLFRTGVYRSIVEPQSYAGQTELLLKSESAGRLPAQVLVLGDSRIAEGFSARLANETPGLRFVNGGVPGSTLRCWYYLLRDLDPGANKYRAVVLAVDSYDDEDGAWDWADRLLDLHILIFRLRLTDAWDFAWSFHSPGDRLQALLGSLLKGVILKDDVQALLAHPAERLQNVDAFRRSGAEWRYNYEGNPASLAGLQVDWTHRSITFPPGVSQSQRQEIRETLFRPTLPQTGAYAHYRREWLGRIVTRYRGRKTRVIVIRVPRGPVPARPRHVDFPRTIPSWHAPDLTVLPQNTFDNLQQPQYFFDALHMNSAGRRLFSPMLARLVREEFQ